VRMQVLSFRCDRTCVPCERQSSSPCFRPPSTYLLGMKAGAARRLRNLSDDRFLGIMSLLQLTRTSRAEARTSRRASIDGEEITRPPKMSKVAKASTKRTPKLSIRIMVANQRGHLVGSALHVGSPTGPSGV